MQLHRLIFCCLYIEHSFVFSTLLSACCFDAALLYSQNGALGPWAGQTLLVMALHVLAYWKAQ